MLYDSYVPVCNLYPTLIPTVYDSLALALSLALWPTPLRGPDGGGAAEEAACAPQSFVADDGCLHIVAERASIREALARLDLGRARLLTRLALFWVRRVR